MTAGTTTSTGFQAPRSRVHEYDVRPPPTYSQQQQQSAAAAAASWPYQPPPDVVTRYSMMPAFNTWAGDYSKYRADATASWAAAAPPLDPPDPVGNILPNRKKKRKILHHHKTGAAAAAAAAVDEDVHSVSTAPGADSPSQNATSEHSTPAFNWVSNSFDGGFALFGDACATSVPTDLGLAACWDLPTGHTPDDDQDATDREPRPYDGVDVLKTEAAMDVWIKPEIDTIPHLDPLLAPTTTTGTHQDNETGDQPRGRSELIANPQPESAASSNSSSRERKRSTKRTTDDGDADGSPPRPELTEAMLSQLVDITEFRNNEKYAKHIVPYEEGISFPLGEGGRELLRACLNVRGCKGRQLQGASVPNLLQLAQQWRLWDVAIRIKVERSVGQLCPTHEAFVKFKATQSALRKFVKKDYMEHQRDGNGRLDRIVYDESRKIILGKEGRETLRALLRRQHEKEAAQMDRVLSEHGFKYSELRNATVQQLSRMAFVCNLWDKVESACRSQEEKKGDKGRTRRPEDASSGSPAVSVVDACEEIGGVEAVQQSSSSPNNTVAAHAEALYGDPATMLPDASEVVAGVGGSSASEFVNIFDHSSLPELLNSSGQSLLADQAASYFDHAVDPTVEWGALQWQS